MLPPDDSPVGAPAPRITPVAPGLLPGLTDAAGMPIFQKRLLVDLPYGGIMDEEIRIDLASAPAPLGEWTAFAWGPLHVVRVRHLA